MGFFPSTPEEQEALSRERSESSGVLQDTLLSALGAGAGFGVGAATSARAMTQAEAKLPSHIMDRVNAGTPLPQSDFDLYNNTVKPAVAGNLISKTSIGAQWAPVAGRLVRSTQERLPWYVPATAVAAPLTGSLLARLGTGQSKPVAIAAAVGGGLVSSLGGIVENYGRKSKLEEYDAARAKVAAQISPLDSYHATVAPNSLAAYEEAAEKWAAAMNPAAMRAAAAQHARFSHGRPAPAVLSAAGSSGQVRSPAQHEAAANALSQWQSFGQPKAAPKPGAHWSTNPNAIEI